MHQRRQYTVEGLVIDVPLRYDKQSDKYLEDYMAYMEKTVFTPGGAPVMFAGEDACEYAEEATPGGCPDCGSCRHYKRAGEHTWIGVCLHDKRKNIPRQNE